MLPAYNEKVRYGTYKNKTCSIDGCECPAYCRWMCNTHYYRWLHNRPLMGKEATIPGSASANDVIYRYKRDANRREIEIALTKEEMMEIFRQKCYYCGASPSNEHRNNSKKYNGSFIYNGIDRLDNTQGYYLFNVVPCCGVCNRMKSDMTEGDFIEQIEKIHKRISNGKSN